jgi:hypothetical protein
MWALTGALTLDENIACAPDFVADVTKPFTAGMRRSMGKFDLVVTCYCYGDVFGKAPLSQGHPDENTRCFINNMCSVLAKSRTLACLVPVSERHRALQLPVKSAMRRVAATAGLARLTAAQKRAFYASLYYLNDGTDEGVGKIGAKIWVKERKVDVYVHANSVPWFHGAGLRTQNRSVV